MNRNHNRRRNVNAIKKDSSDKPLFKKPAANFDNKILLTIARELEELVDVAKNYPLKAIATVFAFIASVAAVKALISGGDSAAVGYHNSAPSLLSGIMKFLPGRVMAFSILTMSIGWFISIAGIWLTSRPTEIRNIFAHATAAFGAILLALSIESIFSQDIIRQPLLFLFLGIAGATASIYIAKTNFRLNPETNMAVIAARASLLANFACITAGLIVFNQVSGLSL